MATVTLQLQPGEALFLTTNFPQYRVILGSSFPIPVLGYDATTDEAAFWTFTAANYGSGNITVRVWWYADTGSSGNVVFEAQISALTANTDTQDVETDGLATLNFVQDTHLGTTAQRLHSCDIALSNLDSIAAGDYCTLRLARDANGTSATDDMAGDVNVVLVALLYSDT